MKKQYVKPTTTVAEIQQTGFICASNTVTSLGGGIFGYGGGGTEIPRGRELDDFWEDDAIDWQE